MKFSATVFGLAALLSAVNASPIADIKIEKRAARGEIATPAAGTAIKPGETFSFSYSARNDYCVTSHNFSVWLWTSPPDDVLGSLKGANGGAHGHFFGRYGIQTSQNPNVPNPVPATLTMPDLSKGPTNGFGQGQIASDLPVYLAVIEEFRDCSASVGDSIALGYTPLIYNATQH